MYVNHKFYLGYQNTQLCWLFMRLKPLWMWMQI